jgi:hypothetical protein
MNSNPMIFEFSRTESVKFRRNAPNLLTLLKTRFFPCSYRDVVFFNSGKREGGRAVLGQPAVVYLAREAAPGMREREGRRLMTSDLHLKLQKFLCDSHETPTLSCFSLSWQTIDKNEEGKSNPVSRTRKINGKLFERSSL